MSFVWVVLPSCKAFGEISEDRITFFGFLRCLDLYFLYDKLGKEKGKPSPSLLFLEELRIIEGFSIFVSKKAILVLPFS